MGFELSSLEPGSLDLAQLHYHYTNIPPRFEHRLESETGELMGYTFVNSETNKAEKSGQEEQTPGNRIVGSQQALLTAPGAPPGDLFTTPREAAQTRPHIFVSKTIIMPEACVPCGKRIRFGRIALKCRSCSVVAHPDCKDRCPALCAPNFTVTSVKNGEGTVADFAPQTIPMIPSLVIHCINEIEQRGLQEPGIYRIPGGERTVRELKENYVRGKGLPLLSRVSNIHVVCGLLKDFLRKLKEPLVTFKLHSTFMALTDLPDNESSRGLSRAVCSLPRANRDTLAFLIIHLQRVMESPECRMDKQNIARVFGPTIVGHSNPNPNPLEVFEDTQRQPKVVEQLLSLSSDYWNQIVPVGQETAQMGPSNTEPGLLIVGENALVLFLVEILVTDQSSAQKNKLGWSVWDSEVSQW
ncbi:rac GTPase-activating protein 1-like [Cetorhinus maximus]